MKTHIYRTIIGIVNGFLGGIVTPNALDYANIQNYYKS